MEQNDTLDRRKFISAGIGTALAVGGAGCSSDDGDSEDDGSGLLPDGGEDATGSDDDETDFVGDEDNSNLRSITLGETREGVVEESDPRDPVRESLAEPVELLGQAGQAVRIAMESGPLDPYLVLVDPGGDVVAQNDDAGGLDSRIETTLRTTGTYTIWAGTFGRNETGPYTLSAEESEVSNTPGTPDNGGDSADLRAVFLGQTAESEIDESDPRDPVRESLAEPVGFPGEGGQVVRISMESGPLDPYLILVGPGGGVVAENDDTEGLNSQIETTLEETGTYTIWAGTFEGDETGPYTLTLQAGSR